MCQNNYECTSNQCSSGQCVDLVKEVRETQGLLKKLINWIKAALGIELAAPAPSDTPLNKVAAFAVTRSPLGNVHESTKNAIASNAREVCLGGLTIIGGADDDPIGPPILGDENGMPIKNPAGKFGDDLTGKVASDYLECSVPCSNTSAAEIHTAYAFDGGSIPFHLQAVQTCSA